MPANDFDFQRFTANFIVEEIKKNAQTRFPHADFNFDSLKVNVEFSDHLNAYVAFASQSFYSTTDSSRFETKEEKKTEVSEEDIEMVPEKIRDHIKHLILEILILKLKWRWKINWIKPNYIPMKRIVTRNTFITKHITTLEYTCPHMKLPGSHRSHVIHLAQGVPSLRDYAKDEINRFTRPY